LTHKLETDWFQTLTLNINPGFKLCLSKCNLHRYTVAEMRVLSQCDELVGSYGSSFSAVAASWGAIERYDVRADGSYWQSGMSEPCWRFASRGHGEAVANSPDLPYHEGCHEVGLYKLSSVYP
jgi:hypothetical protein